jgi:A/G-specific adenine glycosylase
VPDYCARKFGVEVDAVSPAPTFIHGFTHFRLRIQPLLCDVRVQPRLAEPGLRWVAAGALAQAALPAPIRKILDDAQRA